MTLRAIVEDRSFRTLLAMGVLVGLLTLGITYADSGRVGLVDFALFVALVAVVGALLVSYWNYVDRRAETE